MAEIPFDQIGNPGGNIPTGNPSVIPFDQIGAGPGAQAQSDSFQTPSWMPRAPNLTEAIQGIPDAVAKNAGPINTEAAGVVAQGMKQIAGDTLSLLSPLAYPLRGAAGLATRLADEAGVAPGASSALIGQMPKNPTTSDYFNQAIPNITFLDLADFMAGKSMGSEEKYAAPLIANGVAPADAYKQYANLRLAARAAGVLGDFVLDPLAYTAWFQPTEAARIAREQGLFKSAEDIVVEHAAKGVTVDPATIEGQRTIIEGGLGDFKSNSRNLIDVKTPAGKVSAALPEKAQDAASAANRFTDSLDYTFRIPQLDYAASQNNYDKAKAFYDIKNQFLKDLADLQLNPDEQRLVGRLVENTPNLMPKEIPSERLQIRKVDPAIEKEIDLEHATNILQMFHPDDLMHEIGNNPDLRFKMAYADLHDGHGNLTSEHTIELAHVMDKKYPGPGPVRPNIGVKMVPFGSELGTYDMDALRKHMSEKIDGLAQGLNANLERREEIIDGAMAIKHANSQINGRQFSAGLIPEEHLSSMIMKNYLAHVPSDEGRAAAKLKALSDTQMQSLLENQEKTISKGFDQIINSSRLSGFNQTRMERSILLPMEEAQKQMSELYGVKNFYVDNPFISTAMRWAQSEKLIADKKFLDQLIHFGVEPASKEQRLALQVRGWGPLDIPDFKGKTLTVKIDGIPKSVTMESRLFPPNVVSKVGHWIKPREVGAFGQWIGAYNRVFKTMALMTPGFHLRNTVEDLFKYYTTGGSVKNMVTGTVAQLLPLLPGSVARSSVEINGVKRTYAELAEMAKGLRGASLSRDPGLAEHMFAGKQVFQTIGSNLKDPIQMAKNIVHSMYAIGEGGVHAMRSAQYFDLLDKGYSQSAALFRTEQLMFDFRRATPAIDVARTYWDPFIQHAIKTAFLTPELVAKNPAAYNRFITNLPKYLSWAMSDPVTSQYLNQVAPDYIKHRDPVGSLLLPGDSFLAAMFQPPKQGMAMFVTPEFGPGILRKFNIWDDQVVKQRLGFGPAMNSLITVVTGMDQQNKPVDADPNHPDFVTRALRASLDAASTAAFATPGVLNWVRDMAGMQVPNALPSTNMKLAQAMFGQFIHFDDFNKDYMFKSIALQGAYSQLQRQLPTALARELQGKDISLYMADKPKILRDLYEKAYPSSAQSIWDRYSTDLQDQQMSRAGIEGLTGQKSASQIFSEMKGIKQTLDRMNQVHEDQVRAMLEARSKSK